jgi:hypothetical protein
MRSGFCSALIKPMFQVYRRREDSPDSSEWHFNTCCPDWPNVDYVQLRYLSLEEREHICPECKRLEAEMYPSQRMQ